MGEKGLGGCVKLVSPGFYPSLARIPFGWVDSPKGGPPGGEFLKKPHRGARVAQFTTLV